jgi:septum formation protein
MAATPLSNVPLILASSSPRRRQLLSEAGYAFQVIEPHESAESGDIPGETPEQLVVRLANQKAQDVARRIERGLVIGCDTVAVCEGKVLGKPSDRGHAREMLQHLRGTEHRVVSGLCLWRRPDDFRRTEIAITSLIMDPLTDAQIEAYLDTNGWAGKAGAFGYQDGLDWVHVVEGSESNVVGLPLELLGKVLPEVCSG